MQIQRTPHVGNPRMPRRLSGLCAGLMLAVGVGAHTVGHALCHGGPDQAYFRWAMVEDANPLPNGLMWVGYRDQDQGLPTHASLHRVVRVLSGADVTLPDDELGRFTLLVLDGTLEPLSYVIMTRPLYYGTDLDEIGLPRQLWLDAEEDGINGNEIVAPSVVADFAVPGLVVPAMSPE